MENQKKLIGPVLLSIAVVVIAGGLFYYLAKSRALPEGLIAASGRIEGERIVAAAKYPGRISALFAKEGDSVNAGAIVAQLEDQSFQSKVEQARQLLNASQAQLDAAQANIAIARREVPIGVALAATAVSQAQAMLSKAQALANQAQRDAERNHDLYTRGVIELHRAEQADLAWQVAQADLIAAGQALGRARQGAVQAGLGSDKVSARDDDIKALRAQRERAAAALSEANSVLSDLVIHAPAAGVVLSRLREPGEMVMPGGSVLEMVNLDHLYLKVYVPEARIGQLRLGLPARIYTDARPDHFYAARVSYISARAEFTPKEVQTTDERVKLVYAVKLDIVNNPEHQLTPGIPADAVVRWQEGTAWQKPRWN